MITERDKINAQEFAHEFVPEANTDSHAAPYITNGDLWDSAEGTWLACAKSKNREMMEFTKWAISKRLKIHKYNNDKFYIDGSIGDKRFEEIHELFLKSKEETK